MHYWHPRNSPQAEAPATFLIKRASSALIKASGTCLFVAVLLAAHLASAVTPITQLPHQIKVVQAPVPRHLVFGEIASSLLDAMSLANGRKMSTELGAAKGRPLPAHEQVVEPLEGGEPHYFFVQALQHVGRLLKQIHEKADSVSSSTGSIVNVPDPAAAELFAVQAPTERDGLTLISATDLGAADLVRLMRTEGLSVDEHGGVLLNGPIIAGRIELSDGQSVGFAKLLPIDPVHGPKIDPSSDDLQPEGVFGVRVWAHYPGKWLSERHEWFEVIGWDILFENAEDPSTHILRPFRSEHDVILPGVPAEELMGGGHAPPH